MAEHIKNMQKITKGDHKSKDAKKEDIDKSLKAANKNTMKNSMQVESDSDEDEDDDDYGDLDLDAQDEEVEIDSDEVGDSDDEDDEVIQKLQEMKNRNGK